MPDYRHIKKKAENENQEYQRKLEMIEAKFFSLESKLVDVFVKRVRALIEDGVYSYYKDGKCPNIHRVGMFFPKYIFLRKKWWNIRVSKKYEIEKIDVDAFFSNPQQVVNTNFLFPSEKCVNSFLERANRILDKDKIKISIEKDEMTKCPYFSVFARLGKL